MFSHPNDHQSRRVVVYAIWERLPMLSVTLHEERGEITSSSLASVWKPSLVWESRSKRECSQ